ncbi:hypothetical protein GOV14_01090 [Candidatus Pacearchaeota archaeon]|nr:hypothetical protein [Candidatus Pacearchaeota archaeon]
MGISFWLVFGFAAQACFFSRFLVQWIASEKSKKSVIPIAFWYLSLLGGIGIFIYAVNIRDIVFMSGQGLAVFIYLRNLILIYREKNETKNKP